jgi:hypothetical protein
MLKTSFDIDGIPWVVVNIEQMPLGLAYTLKQ